MLRTMFKSKIHRASVTQANLEYMGSLTVDEDLIEAADLYINEKVTVININTGARFETYIIKGERGSGVIGLNGGAARLGEIGDKLIVISYGLYTDEEAKNHSPKVVMVNENNRI